MIEVQKAQPQSASATGERAQDQKEELERALALVERSTTRHWQHERELGELSMARDLTLQCNDEGLQSVTKACSRSNASVSGPAPDGVGAKAAEGDDSGAGTTGLESPEDRTDNELTCE